MTRKIFPLVVVLALMAGALLAQDKSVTLTGYLIDNACAANHANTSSQVLPSRSMAKRFAVQSTFLGSSSGFSR